MAEFDLIPDSYRERIKTRRWCQWFIGFLIVLILIVFGLKTILDRQNRQDTKYINTLQQKQKTSQKQQQTYNNLLVQEKQLRQKITLFNALQGAVPLSEILLDIDQAISDGIWFLDWSFYRNRQLLAHPDNKANNLFEISPIFSISAKPLALKTDTFFIMKGQVKQLSTLTDFVKNLSEKNKFKTVLLEQTQLRQFISYSVVEFDLNIIINDLPGSNEDL